MNRLFYERLKESVTFPFELIVIDNNSKDGSTEFFQEFADKVIVNDDNYSYPYCQNQGIKAARYEYLAFFNNDILVSKDWDARIISIMDEKGIDIISFATNDHMENRSCQRKIQRRWKFVKYPMKALFGLNIQNLKVMAFLSYGNFNKFCERRYKHFGNQTIEGYSGSSILMRRSALEKIGLWDERIQAADFDLFNRVKTRAIEHGDILPIQLATGVFFHHYQRLSNQHVPFADQKNHIDLEDKWGDLTAVLRKDIQ